MNRNAAAQAQQAPQDVLAGVVVSISGYRSHTPNLLRRPVVDAGFTNGSTQLFANRSPPEVLHNLRGQTVPFISFR